MAVARLALGRFEDAALAAWEVSDQQQKVPARDVSLYSCISADPYVGESEAAQQARFGE